METESSEVYKVIHEGAEVYLNGRPIGNGEVGYEVETPYEEAWYGEMGPSKPRPAKRTFRITMPEVSQTLREDWIIKRYAPDGSIKEATFSGQEEAQRAMQLFRDLGLEGHFELVCRPRAEDVVVERHHLAAGPSEDEGEPGSPGLFDESKQYIDREGDVWSCHESRWSFNRAGAGSSIGSFAHPVAGPFKVLEGSDDFEKSEQLTPSFNMSKTYIDKDGDRWKWREVKSSDHLGEWVCYHRLDEDELTWEPIPPAVYGPYTEED